MRPMICTVLPLALLLACPSVHATPTKIDLEDGADHHVSAQGSFKGGLTSSWEWQFGSKRSAPNITGISAHGLLAAHRLTGERAHEASALRAAKSLIKAYDGGWKNRRPKTQDIEFLAAAGYAIDAAKWFAIIRKRWSAEQYVDYVVSARLQSRGASLAGWDIASAIRAALAVGQVRYARGLLARLIDRRGLWDARDRLDAQNLSAASLLWSVTNYKKWSRLSAKERRFADSMARRVLAAQLPSGGMTTRDRNVLCTQTTAYGAIGLAQWGATGRRASALARSYLQRVAIKDTRFFVGGRIWASYYDRKGRPSKRFVSEVQSEVLLALASGTK